MRRPATPEAGRPPSRGSALILALLVIATLSGLAVAFADASRTEASLAGFYRDGFRAKALARAGHEAALWALFADEDFDVDGPGEAWSDFDGTDVPVLLDDGASMSGRIEDESGKLNVNMLFGDEGEIDEARAEQVRRLLEILGLERSSCEALLDWLDPDDIKRMDGAESYHYQALETPYPCANGPLLSPGQTRLVRGLEEGDLLPFITVYTDGKINVNTAPAEVLQSLDEGLDPTVAEGLISRRNDLPFASVEEVGEVAGMDPELFGRIRGFLTVKSSTFTVTLDARWGDTTAHLRSVVARDEEKGPLLLYWKVV